MSSSTRLKAISACSLLAILGLTAQVQADDKPVSTTASTASSSSTSSSSSASDNTIVVVGKKAPASQIDRRTYDVKDNPQAQTGTVGDALNTIPSVNVAPDGTVSVRGKENVEIYVNGKPSAMLQGDNRATTLQSLSGSALDKVEVITSPSAQFSSNGGTIVNLVLKKNKGLGFNAAITMNYGAEGRYNGGYNMGYDNGALTIWHGLNARHDVRKNESAGQREDVSQSQRYGWQNNQTVLQDHKGMWTGGKYRLSEKSSLGFSSYFGNPRSTSHQSEQNRSYDALGNQLSAYERRSTGYWKQTYGEAGLEFEIEGDTEGEKFDVEYEHHRLASNNQREYRNIYAQPSQADSLDRLTRKRVENGDRVQLDAVVIYDSNQRLSYGLKWDRSDNRLDNAVLDVDAATGIATRRTTTSNIFLITQTLSAAYASFQQPLGQGFGGKWTVLAGLRAENILNEFPQSLTQPATSSEDTQVNPSLHLSLDTSETTKLKASYSRRLNRPNVQDLNPFLIYNDPQNVRSGNPNLKSETVDSFEMGYEYAKAELSYNADIYYRQTQGMISDDFVYISPGVLLTTKQNLGESRFGGVSFSVTGKPSKIINYSLNADLFYNEMPDQTTSGKARRTGASGNGKASLDYRPNDVNSYQISANFQGAAKTSQGERSGTSAVNLAWKHKFSPKLSLVVTGSDIFDGAKVTNITQTPKVNSTSYWHQYGRAVFIGLSFTPTAKAKPKSE